MLFYKKGLLFISLVTCCWSLVEAYKTVVVVHGLNCGAGAFQGVKDLIQQQHPGTNVILLVYSEDLETFDPLPEQLYIAAKRLHQIIEDNKDGIHLVCHSQGGLICLGAIQKLNNNSMIHSFISLSSPIFGQFGIPGNIFDNQPLLKPLLNISRELVSPIMYTDLFQQAASIANYWKDPRSSLLDKYEEYSSYLPYRHNDPAAPRYNAAEAKVQRDNLIRLKKLVLIGGPQDEIIKPWQSALFGYYDDDPNSEHIIDMKEQKIYINDWIGLRTLDKRGDLIRFQISGSNHDAWPTFPAAVKAYMPFLT